MKAEPLSGSVALVTAAARGIGRSIALDLAQHGADVALGVRDPEGAAALADEIRALGRSVAVVAMDVTDLAACREAVDRVAAEFGTIDILVNNAGGSIVEDAFDVTEEHFDAVWSLTTKSTFFISQYVARHMRTVGRGSIVNIASQAGLVALPGESSYCTSKAAVIHLTKCLAVEWGQYGIRVNAVAPTFIETDGTAPALSDDAFRDDTVDRIAALHRIGQPHEVAAAVTFLAGEGASLITGTALPIDGGWTAR
ncbi:3-oxoacyl-ACP reductase [Curtobacterium sp. MCBD17_013]|uniref:SDR family NAD(P)-dependent oxidoreductase n=1 Tax=unclassified Curtobacterium TaxID=257496 RepID=UPI000DA83167|nr:MULTISPECIES: SDR family NAD(P)-dependent oxidoreductase [unclassified Curtobacterium]PZF63297.1 3-oxoacyl-ACP reductase [Curtobacterium sp. MCBD17_013]WIB64284.1 SDR family NAD(P)-dependent oxidoreductase [Curtobacterium sp. MCBD17_040]WIB68145.1 SDR family NAD(P)-dependent oxidoreductase [Curtobacterium sp. MCBD17_035]WIE55308.1 SDR family NAD(P)-dependent oxidoreductase [Curtobacterium sp. MCBD17_003]